MNVAVVAGGTGGHIFPALSTLEEMKSLSSKSSFVWITTGRGREKELAQEYEVTPLILSVEGIKRSFSFQPIRALLKFAAAFVKMFHYLRRNKIDRVVAFGGYVCAPVLLAARLRGIPYFLQEQNSVPGMVNRMFGKGAEKLFLGVPLAEGFRIDTRTELTGNPVRTQSAPCDEDPVFTPAEGAKVVLICGGSQGAVSMNRVLIDAVEWMASKGIHVIWQTGHPGFEEVSDHFKGNAYVTAVASVNNLYPYYEQADLLVGRSGASTISEAALFNLPSILIPLPWSSENHQWFNAGYAEEAGWALRFAQDSETSDKIIREIETLFFENDERLNMMKLSAQKASRPNAAHLVAQEVLVC